MNMSLECGMSDQRVWSTARGSVGSHGQGFGSSGSRSAEHIDLVPKVTKIAVLSFCIIAEAIRHSISQTFKHLLCQSEHWNTRETQPALPCERAHFSGEDINEVITSTIRSKK